VHRPPPTSLRSRNLAHGSVRERDALLKQLVASGTLLQVHPELRPYSFVARSHPADVARVEDRTFICTRA
jgi:phosphoenolpyruvate carboxykinase (GTP)